MAKYANMAKLAWLKGMEAIGKGASSLASSAHIKVNEINLETRRREILSEFPIRAHDLWQKGISLPEPLGDMMSELNELDEKLSVLRAQRYAKVESDEADAPETEELSDNDAPQSEEAAPEEAFEAAEDIEQACGSCVSAEEASENISQDEGENS